jgi:IS605 OrfB family transposase
MKSELPTFTYQTRLSLTPQQEAILEAYAKYMSLVERKLFAGIAAGKNSSYLKTPFLVQFGITARQYNACRVQVEGQIASIKQRRVSQIVEAKERIEALEKKIEKLLKQKGNARSIHQKKRRLYQLKCRLKKQEADHKEGKIRLCFGSKKLFRSQFALEANEIASHQEWLSQWQEERNNSFFLLGSKDETSGNQSCTAVIQDNSLTLQLRLPNILSNYGKHLEIANVSFKYGFESILASLQDCKERNALLKANDPLYKEYGQAISYRFKKDKKGWLLFASTSLAKPVWRTREGIGAIGIDINANHLAAVETDRYGNSIKSKIIPLNCYGKTSDQTKALIGNVIAELVQWGVSSQKSLVVEKLDFQKKKNELKESGNRKYARMLSSLAYTNILTTIKSRAWRFGVKVKEVNPAYTSVIGRVKFSDRYGLTIHESAALCIARRFQGVSERLPGHLDKIPDGKSGHVALPLPVRNRGKHVWTLWRQVKKKLPVVLAAHFRATKKRSSSRLKPACCDGLDPLGPCWRNSNTRTVNNTA